MGFLRKIVDRFRDWLTDKCPKCGSAEDIRIVSTDPQNNLIRFRCLHCGYEWVED